MSTLLDWNALELKIKAHIANADEKIDEQTALTHIVLEYVLSIDPEEVEDAITDGSNDRGIDAVYVDSRDGQNTIHIFQLKYVTTFDKAKKNFPSREIDKLISFWADVLEERPNLKKTCNTLLWAKVEEIWDALKRPDPSFVVHTAGNLLALVPPEKRRLEEALAKYKSFLVREHTLETIVELFRDRKRLAVDASLQMVDLNYFERTDGNIRGLIATVEAEQILQLVTDPQDQAVIREAVFDDNVRVYLKRKNQINRKIIASALSSRNADFWYLNNGITMTCDSFSYQAGRRASVVSLRNVQIVNGGQTSHALFEARQDDPDAIRRVLVLVRIYETKTKEISTRIAESTNSQTPINTRDLRSNDDVQKTLEEGFLDLGLYYERKAKQYADRPKQKRVDALAAGQAYLAYILGKPEVAKKDRARVFGDLYDEIFNEDITPQKLYVPLRVLAVIESEKREIQRRIRRQESIDPQQLYLMDGAYHVLYAVAFLINFRQKDLLDEKVAKLLIEAAKQGVAKTVQLEEKADPAFTFNRFFKDPRTRSKIDETLLSLNLLESKRPKRTRQSRQVASRKKK